MPPPRLTLIGYRGAGKTTAGRLAARLLDWDFIDADIELERRTGRGVRDIFTRDGEPAFRDLERLTLADLLARERCVIATGGGVVLREDNRRLLREHGGRVMWLSAGLAATLRRLGADPAAHRPALTALSPHDEVTELLRTREPLYRECADVVVAVDELSPEQVARAIVNACSITTHSPPPS